VCHSSWRKYSGACHNLCSKAVNSFRISVFAVVPQLLEKRSGTWHNLCSAAATSSSKFFFAGVPQLLEKAFRNLSQSLFRSSRQFLTVFLQVFHSCWRKRSETWHNHSSAAVTSSSQFFCRCSTAAGESVQKPGTITVPQQPPVPHSFFAGVPQLLEKAFRNLAQSLFRSSHQFLTGETFVAEAETPLTAR
jgi:hypothetical protein